MDAQKIPYTKYTERSAIGYEDRDIMIPDHIAEKIDGFINRGDDLGHFLSAVVRNDLTEAVCHADPESLLALRAIVIYLYNFAPHSCWGTQDKMDAWRETFTEKNLKGCA